MATDPQIPFAYFLQGADPTARRASRRYLVAISVLGEEGIAEAGAVKPLPIGRIDAAVHGPDGLLAVFELKVGANQLDKQQLDRHAEKWQIPHSGRRLVRWSDVYRWTEHELTAGHHDQPESFLLQQFREFLELTELAPFRGFRHADFDFFLEPDPELRPIVKNRLAGVGELVVSLLTEAEREAIGEVHVGQLGAGADHAWLDTQHRQDVVNLTVELYVDELQVNIVGWRRDQAGLFERWLLSNSGQKKLRTLRSHELVIYERSAHNIARRDLGARPWWQREHIRKVAQCEAQDITPDWIEQQLSAFNDRAWQKPGFHIRRRWPRAAVVSARETIAHEVADEVRLLLPLLQAINQTPA